MHNIILGTCENFVYLGEPETGHVDSVARPGTGCRTTAFGDRGYWRYMRNYPTFGHVVLTDAGRDW